MILVDAAGLGASRPGKPLFTDLSLTLSSGDRLAIVGLNGTGKSTLLRFLAGIELPESGSVRRGRGARVVMLDQQARLPAGSVRDAVGSGWEVESVLQRLGVADVIDTDVATLSGGQAKRVALAQALVAVGPGGGPDDDAVLLILDEPTNHLDLMAVKWLEDRLSSNRGGLVLVTHDRHLLDRVTTRIVEIDRGDTFVHEGGYASYLDARFEREVQAANAENTRRNLARKELAWLRRGAPARTRKPKAHIASALEVVNGRAQAPARATEDLPLHFGTPRLGDHVVELTDVGHRFGDGPWLFQGVNLSVDPRERLGIVGPNGAGKSTLLEIISGRLTPTTGTVSSGSTVVQGWFDQHGPELDPTIRVRDAVAGPTRQPDWQDARLLEEFWFGSDAQWAPIGLLSGGERRRLQLLLTLAAKPNVLLLDEPTNDLDLDTLRVLEDFLDDWAGALLVISHDRAFLERTVADVIVIDDTHDAERVPGGFGAWESSHHLTASRTLPGTAKAAASTAAPRPSRSAPASATTAKSATSAPPRRSASTLRHLLKETERELRQAERQREALTAQLESLGTAGDHQELARVGHELADVTARLAACEDQWLTLSEEAER